MFALSTGMTLTSPEVLSPACLSLPMEMHSASLLNTNKRNARDVIVKPKTYLGK